MSHIKCAKVTLRPCSPESRLQACNVATLFGRVVAHQAPKLFALVFRCYHISFLYLKNTYAISELLPRAHTYLLYRGLAYGDVNIATCCPAAILPCNRATVSQY